MSARRRLAAVSVVVGACMLLAACGAESDPTVDLTKAEPGIQKIAQQTFFPTLTVGAATCPKKAIPRSKGRVSVCTVRVQSIPVQVKVVQTNAQGGILPLRYEAILSTAKAEEFIRTRIRDVATVDCGSAPYFVRKPGEEFHCPVTATNGRQSEVFFRVVDPKGNIRFVRNT